MSEKLAQAAPNNGGSNATDFQPTTRNPQRVPENLIQQQRSLQNVTNPQELLNEQRNVRITVTKQPAPSSAQVIPTKDATGLVLLSAVAIVLAILLFKFSNKLPGRSKSVPAAQAESETIASEEVASAATQAVTTPEIAEKADSRVSTTKEVIQLSKLDRPTKKKKSSKKSKSKRRHR